jgi:thioredoxin reductase
MSKHSEYGYVIVGAGPAGLQLGYFLRRCGAKYLILDRGKRAGSFFETYPRHRKLLSINKRHTGRSDWEFNLRHDWNSLVTAPEEHLRFSEFSDEYFPNADALVQYLNAFADRFQLNVQYDSEVTRIERADPSGHFEITLRSGEQLRATCVIVATGLYAPFLPPIPGIELAVGYEDMSVNAQDFAGKSVLILGKGNSALETANHLMPHASVIHLSSPEPIKFAWNTHFVGDVRSVNSQFFDSYLLKSQNGVLDGETREIRRLPSGKLCVRWASRHTELEEEIEQMEYDVVIRCTGFRFDDHIFGTGGRPEMHRSGRLPRMNGSWESTNVPGLFFAGTLMQALDYKHSQSSFIHGFRHDIETLAAVLQDRYQGMPLPFQDVDCNAGELAKRVIERTNTTCSLWQLVGFMCDLIVLPRTPGAPAQWYRHLTERYVREGRWGRDPDCEYYIVAMAYGPSPGRFSAFDHDHVHKPEATNVHGELTSEIHPVIRRYRGETLVRTYHVRTDFLTDWDADFYRVPLEEFFQHDLAGQPIPTRAKPKRRELRRNGEMRFAELKIIDATALDEPTVGMARTTRRMQDVLAAIDSGAKQYASRPLFRLLEQHGTLEDIRTFIPTVTFFAFTFQDVLRLNEQRVSSEKLRGIVAQHRREDAGHETWLYRDMRKLGVEQNIPSMFGKRYQVTRDTAFELVSEVYRASSDATRLAIPLALESTGDVFFEAVTGFFERAGVSEGLEYFSRRHWDVERGHSMFEGDHAEQLRQLALTTLERDECIGAVERIVAALVRWAEDTHEQMIRARLPSSDFSKTG